MTHARKQIRDAFVTTATGLATTGNKVTNGQRFPFEESQLPRWIIYPGAETISDEEQVGAMGSVSTMIRFLEIKCLGVVRSLVTNEPIENTLDGMLEELETAIAGGIGVSGVLGIQLVSVEPDYETDADNLYGSIEATFVVQYRTPENAPGTIV